MKKKKCHLLTRFALKLKEKGIEAAYLHTFCFHDPFVVRPAEELICELEIDGKKKDYILKNKKEERNANPNTR